MSGLARRLITRDAVVIGVGSMIGAGLFAVWGPASRAVGPGGTGAHLLLALALAAAVAYANAMASAQLAAQYPMSGGTYVYGRERLGPWWGFLAGWGFVVGKTASCAAMALTFAAYAAPPGWQRPVAAAAVVGLVAVNYRGVTRTARLTRWIVALTLGALVVWMVVTLGGGQPDWSGVFGSGSPSASGEPVQGLAVGYGIVQAAGLLFFAFAGYARIASMGEEVRDPERTIPRAILISLGVAALVYTMVAVTLLAVLGLSGIAGAPAPLTAAAGSSWANSVVRVAAAAASLGALLALIAGVGRTALAMAREGDLPRWMAVTHPQYRVPHRAEIALAVVVVVLVVSVDLRGAIGFSSFGVLVYYAIANASAWTQDTAHRRFPRFLQVAGLTGCVALSMTLPLTSVIVGFAVLSVGLALRASRLARRSTD